MTTVQQAFAEFTESMEFKMIAKNKDALGSKFRVYLNRFRKDELRFGAMAEILQANGYEIKAGKVIKKK